MTLGRGKRLLGGSTPVDRLEMTSHTVTAKGTIIATYKPGGTLPPYPAEGPIPVTSEREVARQAAIAERPLVTGLTLYVHPFSSFSWKALIPLWADGTPFTYRNVDPSNPGVMDELKAHWPLGKFPTLVDNGQVIPEATCIIEHLQAHHPGPTKWIPDGDEGRRVRLLDRFFDLHIQGNMQPSVNHAIWPDGEGLAAAARSRGAAHRLRLARGQFARRWLGGRRQLHPRRLRRRAGLVLRRLDRADRRRASAPRRLSPAPARPSGGRRARSRKPAPTATISRWARPTAIDRLFHAERA